MACLGLRTNLFVFAGDVPIRVVRVPSTSHFPAQSDEHCEQELPTGVPLPATEPRISLGWRSRVGPQITVIAFDTFGASVPGSVAMERYSFAVNNICGRTLRALPEIRRQP